MSHDLQQYAAIIEKLKSVVKEPEFDQVLTQLTTDLPREKRFLIKMELKRLARPCMRSVDLRGQVDGDCQLYEHQGIRHYLDAVALEVFEQQIRLFGYYCFGVYEAMQHTENNFRVMRDKALETEETKNPDRTAATLERYDVPQLNMLDYATRQHERMNFAVSIEVVSEGGVKVRGNTVDISTSGLRIKTGQHHLFQPGEHVQILFRGLEDEFSLDKKNGIVYQVIKIIPGEDVQYLQLKRATEFANGPFDRFLENFIHGNKRRYKVNISNTIEAIVNKSMEQCFSPLSPELPVFIDDTDGTLSPRFAMYNTVNRDILSYWSDETEELRLGYLLNPNRLLWLKKRPEGQRQTFVYCFSHLQNEKTYFYSATSEELIQKDILKKVFLGFGSRKASWRVFKLSMTEMQPEQAHSPLSIPDSVGNKIKRQNSPPSPRLMSRLKNLGLIVHICDVTSEEGQERYSENKFNRSSLSHLRLFGHPRNRPPVKIETFRYKFEDQRLETRYLLRSKITLEALESGQKLGGISEDISISGLRIELNGEYRGDIDSQVAIGFPALQAMTQQHQIMDMQYQVVHYNRDKNILHLKAVPGNAGQSARHFFETLIKQNRGALKPYPDEEEIPGMGHALRCINARNTPSVAFAMSKSGRHYEPQGGIVGQHETRLRRLLSHFSEPGRMNLEFMYRDRNLDAPFIQQGVKQVRTEHQVVRREVFIAFDPSQKESRLAIMPRFTQRFLSDDLKQNFIREALHRGNFVALHVVLATTGKPDLEMLLTEINYVSVYAIHRAKELEEKLWSIAACAHLVDITDEVLMRYRYDSQTIQRNRKLAGTSDTEILPQITGADA
ncbi:PilZ domain-containing protein [Alteromonas aestuariivivens]|uniref:PilZ domain-containing protein n=1 Tax=Alteromonas aestuariivivens TaxID=1938339 RepID=A0A3D8MFQ8_9ALTE|nr:PilZ domain-containing protein [Alteromonas aestuariivivens]RDV29344.1 PilZ domain-containing protein [Alteromonas aestuariivivens]